MRTPARGRSSSSRLHAAHSDPRDDDGAPAEGGQGGPEEASEAHVPAGATVTLEADEGAEEEREPEGKDEADHEDATEPDSTAEADDEDATEPDSTDEADDEDPDAPRAEEAEEATVEDEDAATEASAEEPDADAEPADESQAPERGEGRSAGPEQPDVGAQGQDLMKLLSPARRRRGPDRSRRGRRLRPTSHRRGRGGDGGARRAAPHPPATDVLTSYRVRVNGDGEVLDLERLRRYLRGQASKAGGA